MSVENNTPSTSVEEDIQVLIKVAYHLCNKSYPENGRYSVPAREFERLRAKSNRLQGHLRGTPKTSPTLEDVKNKAASIRGFGVDDEHPALSSLVTFILGE